MDLLFSVFKSASFRFEIKKKSKTLLRLNNVRYSVGGIQLTIFHSKFILQILQLPPPPPSFNLGERNYHIYITILQFSRVVVVAAAPLLGPLLLCAASGGPWRPTST